MIDTGIGGTAQSRLAAVSDTKAGGLDHGKVVGPVADSAAFLESDAAFAGDLPQRRQLGFRPQDRLRDFANQPSLSFDQAVGALEMETSSFGDEVGEKSEAAGHQCGHGARFAHGGDQGARTGIEGHALGHLRHDLCRQVRQHGGALLQGLGEVDLAAHGAGGDLRHARPQAQVLGHFLEHLLADDGRFHIGDQHSLATPLQGLNAEIDRAAGQRVAQRLAAAADVNACEDQVAGAFATQPLACTDFGPRGFKGVCRFVHPGIGEGRAAMGNKQGGDVRHGGPFGRRTVSEGMCHPSGLHAWTSGVGRSGSGNQGRVTNSDTWADVSKDPALLIAGPTASGKSGLALGVAQAFDGVVINADSMQVYRDLRILTARPDEAALAAAPHRLYGVLSGDESCSVGRWRTMALDEMARARQAGRLPIVVGGTGLYLKALERGLSPLPPVDPEVRAQVRRYHRRFGNEGLRRRLAQLDPLSHARLQPGDSQRLLRALEVVESSGRPLSAWQAQSAGEAAPYRFLTISLMPQRWRLYAAIDSRFRAMVEAGAQAEVSDLLARAYPADCPIMKALGVPELSAHLAGELSLEEAISAAQTASRRYAKRQMTWQRTQLWRQKTSFIEAALEDSQRDKSRIFTKIREFLLTPGSAQG